MYHPQRLESPPPPSQFRRPWSPIELEPYNRNTIQEVHGASSEASFEVYDLADVNRGGMYNGHAYAAQSTPSYPEYPSTPPRSFSLASRASYPTSPPSLVSGESSTSPQSARLYTPPPTHRPFSLPPPQLARSPPASNSGRSHNYPWLVEPQNIAEQDEEVDIGAFPEWSRNWYRNQKPGNMVTDPYAPIPTFDPALLSPSHDTLHDFSAMRPYSSTNDSHRSLLPWSAVDGGKGVHVTSEMKEERVRMLEREFGRNSSKQGPWDGESKVIGSVNAKGDIVTPGPKKRIIVRWIQALFALGAAIASLYSALLLKPTGSPPPRGTISAYLLYFLSVITVILMLYMFVFRTCCHSGKRGQKMRQEGPPGMMVLPVQGLPGAPGKKNKKNKKKGKNNDTGGVSVNLIVDPSMFGGFNHRDEEKTDDEDVDTSLNRPGRRRRGLFEGLAMEEQWKVARKQLKRLLFFDIALFFLWGAEFVVILLGKRCPVGAFEGWCDGYNVATALDAFLGISFGLSVFFDIKDLHLSKASPRTRT